MLEATENSFFGCVVLATWYNERWCNELSSVFSLSFLLQPLWEKVFIKS